MTIAVLSRSLGRQCGISEYAICLAERLGGVAVNSVDALPPGSTPVFIQYEPSLDNGLPDLPDEISQVEGIPVIDIHTEIPVDIVPALVSVLETPAIVAVKREPRLGAWFLPHISYAPVGIPRTPPDEIHLGSFGFALPNKRYDILIELGTRLHVPLTILAATANATPGIEELSQAYTDYLVRSASQSGENIHIVSAFLSHEQIVNKLRDCSHLLCAMENLERTSGSMRMMALANRPIISLYCAGADEVGAVQVQSFDAITLAFLKRPHSTPSFPDGLDAYLRLIE